MDFLREIADRSRRSILLELRSGPRNVSEIVAATGLKQPNVSNHLAKLRDRGVVRASKVGRQVFYTLANPEVETSLQTFVVDQDQPIDHSLPLEDVAKSYARAGCAGDEVACTQMIDSLIRQKVPLVRIYQQVLAEAMHYIGRWYEAEAIDEGQEHLASAITERVMARVLHYSGPLPRNAKRAVLGCVPGNWHSIGLRMLSDFLRLSGWRSLFLGANVPTASFAAAVREHAPSLALLSCSVPADLEGALDLTRVLADLRQETGESFVIGAGGPAVVDHSEEFIRAGADFTAANLIVFAEEVLPRLEASDRSLGIFSNHKKID
jgi:methanogenic corrinoid protein MtbC1